MNTKVSFQSASGPLPESIDHGKKEETVFRGRKFSPTVIKELVELEGIEDRACSGRNKNIALAIAALALAAFVLFLTSTSLIILPMGILHTTLLVSGSISMIFSACHFQEKAKSTAKTINRMLQDAPLLGVAA